MHLLAGGTNVIAELDNPAPEWISSRSWTEILTVGSLPTFSKFPGSFYKHLAHYKNYFDSTEPHKLVERHLFIVILQIYANIKYYTISLKSTVFVY